MKRLDIVAIWVWQKSQCTLCKSFQNPSWWQLETFSALLALCAGNSLVTVEFPSQRPVTRNFDVFFGLHLHKRLSKQSWDWWFVTPLCRHYYYQYHYYYCYCCCYCYRYRYHYYHYHYCSSSSYCYYIISIAIVVINVIVIIIVIIIIINIIIIFIIIFIIIILLYYRYCIIIVIVVNINITIIVLSLLLLSSYQLLSLCLLSYLSLHPLSNPFLNLQLFS